MAELPRNPYQSPAPLPKRPPRPNRFSRQRLMRFWRQRRFVFLLCLLAIPLLAIADPIWFSRLRTAHLFQSGFVAFILANVVHFAWLMNKQTRTRPVDWSYRFDLAIVFAALACEVGKLYPCCFLTLSGGVNPASYIAPAVTFGSPAVVFILFTFIRSSWIGSAVSASLIASLWFFQWWYFG